MAPFQNITSLLGIGFAVVVLLLIGRDQIGVRHGLFWFALAITAVVLGVWPKVIDDVALRAGVRYSPTLLLVGAVIVLFIKALHTDIVNTRIERQVRRLNQSLALLYLKAQSEHANGTTSPAGDASHPVAPISPDDSAHP